MSGAPRRREYPRPFIAKTYGITRDFDRVRRGGHGRVSVTDIPTGPMRGCNGPVGPYQGYAA